MIDQKLFKERVKQAYITLSQSEGRVGPRGHANGLPEFVRDKTETAYPDGRKIKRPVTAADISEMEAIFDAIISEITNEEHRIQYQATYYWLSKGGSISDLCKKMRWNRRTLYNRIDKYDQKLIEKLSLSAVFRHRNDDLQVAQNQPDIHPQTDEMGNSVERANHWMTPDARGTIEDFGILAEKA